MLSRVGAGLPWSQGESTGQVWRGWRKAEAIVLRSSFQGKIQAPVGDASLVLEGQGRKGMGRAGAQQNGSFPDLFFPSQLCGQVPHAQRAST